jgi:hypothetical protein
MVSELSLFLSVMIVQGNTYIRQLDEEEIAGMRVACKLGREVSIADLCAIHLYTEKSDSDKSYIFF